MVYCTEGQKLCTVQLQDAILKRPAAINALSETTALYLSLFHCLCLNKENYNAAAYDPNICATRPHENHNSKPDRAQILSLSIVISPTNITKQVLFHLDLNFNFLIAFTLICDLLFIKT